MLLEIIVRVFQSSLHCLPEGMGAASMLTNDLFNRKRFICDQIRKLRGNYLRVLFLLLLIFESIWTSPVLLHHMIDFESTFSVIAFFCAN